MVSRAHVGEGPSRGGRVGEMMRFLRARLDQNVGRRDIAEAFNLTPEHVNYLFKQELGLTPTRFLNRERVLKATRLLQEGGLSVKEAAHLPQKCRQISPLEGVLLARKQAKVWAFGVGFVVADFFRPVSASNASLSVCPGYLRREREQQQ